MGSANGARASPVDLGRRAVEEQFEPWELRSGTWLRDRVAETWRLAATWDGTVVDPRLTAQDVARLTGASREPASGECFPPDFNYSQRTGAQLGMAIPALDPPWAPPFGASALPGAKTPAGGLRQTLLPLALARPQERLAGDPPDRTLPPLPPGTWRFAVDKFGAACPILLAIEPERGHLLVLLPESKSWSALDPTAGASWGQRLRNPRGWRMELVHAGGYATAWCPSAIGLARITPNAIGLCYGLEHAGEGLAIGGPVTCGDEIWAPVLAKGNRVQLVGKPRRAAGHIVLPTRAPVPQHGFEAPVFDDLHVIWPCDEGQLVLRLGADGDRQCEWIAWPEGVRPLFAMGCPYCPSPGAFWQLCFRSDDGGFEYVEMASAAPKSAPVDAPGLCTGYACYHGASRIDGDPWRPAQAADRASTEIVVPLLESAHDGTVVGLRMDAPDGVLALLHAGDEPRRALLQVESPDQAAEPFGRLEVKRPWLALPFVHDGHLWVHHPDLPQAVGWKLAL